MTKLFTLAGTLLAAVALLATSGAPAAEAARCKATDRVPDTKREARTAARATLCLVNVERRKRDRPSLRRSGRLERSAAIYARKMVRHDFFAHVTPGGSTLLDRVRRAGYLRGARGYSLGENIAWGSGSRATPRQIVRSWLDSPGHRRNMLSRSFRHAGIGVAVGAPDYDRRRAATYTNHFGRRG